MAETCCKVKTVSIYSIYTGTEHVIERGYVVLTIFFFMENFCSKKCPLSSRTAQYMLLFSLVYCFNIYIYMQLPLQNVSS
jgi:hypothetical protein